MRTITRNGRGIGVAGRSEGGGPCYPRTRERRLVTVG